MFGLLFVLGSLSGENGTKKCYDPISAPSTVNLHLSSTMNRALRAFFPAVNGCAAHDWGQVLKHESGTLLVMLDEYRPGSGLIRDTIP
jgi:hypothetical protein